MPCGKSASVPMLEELGDLPNLMAKGVRGCELPESSIVDVLSIIIMGVKGT